MSALTLAHGNAVPERVFWVNNALLGEESQSLSEKTIVAARLIKDVMRVFGSVTNVPITKGLVISAPKSYGEYVRYQEEKLCLEALEKQKLTREEIELNFIIKLHICRYESQAYNMH